MESAPRTGTPFDIVLPVAAVPDDVRAASPSECVASPSGHATVLLVEDEDALRRITRRILQRHGYVVLEARHGKDALLLWHGHAAEIDVVIADMRMPEMGRHELVAQLRAERPALAFVLMSGYSGTEPPVRMGGRSRFVESRSRPPHSCVRSRR